MSDDGMGWGGSSILIMGKIRVSVSCALRSLNLALQILLSIKDNVEFCFPYSQRGMPCLLCVLTHSRGTPLTEDAPRPLSSLAH